MPYWNEIPGAGEPAPLNRSRRKAIKHSLLLGPIICAPWIINMAKSYSGDPLSYAMNIFAGFFIFGPFFGIMIISPVLGFFYQWGLIRRREKTESPIQALTPTAATNGYSSMKMIHSAMKLIPD